SAALLNLVPISYVTPEDPEDEAPNYWSTFNTSIMDALEAANASYRAAVGASDLSAAIESYQNAYYETDATLNSSVASAFGTFQIGVRQNRLAGVTSSNPRYSAYASDVTWATQTKSLRDQRVTQYNEDRNEYVEAVVAAQKNYNVNGEKPVVRLVVGETRKAPAKALAFAGAYHLVAIRNASF
ncbi:MAG: hypothetical protein IJL92_04725, partial [Thermoguttaceae bacterium]|nr:hypothetical protein [Thermoguttaceae bacterium]